MIIIFLTFYKYFKIVFKKIWVRNCYDNTVGDKLRGE